jgi:hypothetical protein
MEPVNVQIHPMSFQTMYVFAHLKQLYTKIIVMLVTSSFVHCAKVKVYARLVLVPSFLPRMEPLAYAQPHSFKVEAIVSAVQATFLIQQPISVWPAIWNSVPNVPLPQLAKLAQAHSS